MNKEQLKQFYLNKISYSQYGEDIFLHNLFLNKINGFYIDIGAGDSTIGNNTMFFYKLGWSGICIDPLIQKEYDYELRPNDQIIPKGLVLDNNKEFYYHKEWPYLSSLNKKELKKNINKLKFSFENLNNNIEKIIIETITIKELKNIINNRHIDILSIDIENNSEKYITELLKEYIIPDVILLEHFKKTIKIPEYFLVYKNIFNSIFVKKNVFPKLEYFLGIK